MAASPAAAPSERSVFKTLFVYGPLMAEEACVALLGRMPSHRPATLSGFLRCCKRGAEEVAGVCTTHRSLALAGYPAAVQTNSAEHQVEGLLLERLRPKELRALDFYEDSEYQRIGVNVTASNGFGGVETMEALVYVWPRQAADALQLTQPWAYTEFRKRHMGMFIENIIVPCRTKFEKEEGKLEGMMTDRSRQLTDRRGTGGLMPLPTST